MKGNEGAPRIVPKDKSITDRAVAAREAHVVVRDIEKSILGFNKSIQSLQESIDLRKRILEEKRFSMNHLEVKEMQKSLEKDQKDIEGLKESMHHMDTQLQIKMRQLLSLTFTGNRGYMIEE